MIDSPLFEIVMWIAAVAAVGSFTGVALFIGLFMAIRYLWGLHK